MSLPYHVFNSALLIDQKIEQMTQAGIEEQVIFDTLIADMKDFETEAESLFEAIVEWRSERSKLRAHIREVQDKVDALDRRIHRLSELLMNNMRLARTPKLRYDLVTATVRRASIPKLVVFGPVPTRFLRMEPYTDTAKIRNALLAGEDIGFARLEYTEYLYIQE